MSNNYKKRIRLKDFDYKDCYRYFVTICTFNKKPLFTNDSLVTWLIELLRERSKSFSFKIWAYCFMPDHLHLLIQGERDDSDMRRFISSYKQQSGFYYKKKTVSSLWQINYYEHILGKEEDTKGIAYYIFANPVRKGLVNDFKEYKFLGSFAFDIMQL
ncbi:MAG: transposase [Candidatus Brocadia sp. AMX2]|uniref:Transposase IS200-like domain-containing protein n=1 Tax=Candidatus Brocadia sinica JPN1 TaxID=1197129 RepID=A0ABQ0K1E4_9BACT|nr:MULTISPECIES: transposase [Brocadia]MBC6933925.1 transposase [Candidatus Brocadia sp.]MBL1168830.1 transposase [Candidatus Brocadia sp. AMX1]MCK6468691.1 transposase [Candidatus Brocadia sinica]NOG42707.1 transposase [Planctomycetota bacterium]KAA0241727.1 MAG: transposase [Candidatus Brocadia sp. AMX2]